jgi:hypothetical protein
MYNMPSLGNTLNRIEPKPITTGGTLMTKLDMVGQIADLKEIDYKNTLAITSIIELLIEKGILDSSEVAAKAQYLEDQTLSEIRRNSRFGIRTDFR